MSEPCIVILSMFPEVTRSRSDLPFTNNYTLFMKHSGNHHATKG